MSIFAQRWETIRRRNLREEQNFWDIRADEFDRVTKARERGDSNEVVSYLHGKGALTPDATVLDIGCGTGRYALEFAPRVARVTGLDISPAMIEHARTNAQEAGFGNLEFHALPWQTMDLAEQGLRKRFSLAFASMSPAIDSPAALLKMMEASTRFCFMSGFVFRSDSVTNMLIDRLFGESEPPEQVESIYYAFNILWENGMHAEITYHDAGWQKELETVNAAKIYTAQLKAFARDDKTLEADILRELRKEEKDGHITQTVAAKTGWLFWECGE